ncbi:MAG: DUF5610 domain-containing protein [Thiohalomonadales bacterium]
MISDINSALKSTDMNSALANPALATTVNTADTLTTAQQGETQKAPLVELSSPSKRAYAVLNYEVSVELNMVFGNLGVAPSTPAPDTNNLPNDTADNIVNTVKTASTALEGDQHSELLQHAQDGVDRGVAVAKDVLQSQGALTAQVSAEIATVQETIQSGIAALGDAGNSAPVASESAFVATRSRQQDSGDIQIRTNDGDVISINFNQTQENSMLMAGSTDANGSVFAMASTQSSSVNYSFSIEGNLDKDEREALGKLVHDIEEISDKFFSGELNDAFDKMSELKFDNDEFSGMALNFSRSESLMAIGAYQSVQTMDAPVSNSPAVVENVPAPAISPDTAVVTSPVTQEPAIVVAADPAPVAVPATLPQSVPTTPATISSAPINVAPQTAQTPAPGLTDLQSIIGEVRQLMIDLSEMDIFSKPETIAANIFEGMAKSKAQDGQVAGVASDQFNQILGLLAKEDDAPTTATGDDEQDQEDHVANLAFDQVNQTLGLMSEEEDSATKATSDNAQDQDEHVANLAFDRFNQALGFLSEEDVTQVSGEEHQDAEHGATQPQQMI